MLIKRALWELVSMVGFEPTASCLIDRLSNHYTRLERTKLDSHRDYSCYRRIYKHPMSMWSRGHHVPLPPLSLGSWWYFNMVRDKGNEDRYHICFIIHSHIVNNSTQLLFLIKWALWELVSIVGFEPTTFCLIDRLSNQYTRLERTK